MITQEQRRAEQKEKLKQEVLSGDNPTCWHILGQPLADSLSEIIRDQEKKLVDNMNSKYTIVIERAAQKYCVIVDGLMIYGWLDFVEVPHFNDAPEYKQVREDMYRQLKYLAEYEAKDDGWMDHIRRIRELKHKLDRRAEHASVTDALNIVHSHTKGEPVPFVGIVYCDTMPPKPKLVRPIESEENDENDEITDNEN